MNKASEHPSSDRSRRSFLSKLMATGAALPMVGFAAPAKRAQASPSARPNDARTVAARTVNVFSKHLQFLEYEAMARAAADMGADGVDLTVRPGGHVLPERVTDDLPRAVEAVRGAGLEVPTITTAITDPRDAHTEPILETASALGIGHYRMGSLPYKETVGVAETLEQYRPQFRELAALNADYEVHGAYQNHAGTRVGGPVWDLWTLLQGRDPRWMGCQYDIRHATVEGGRSWPLGLDLLGPYVRTTVIKDFNWAKQDGDWYVKNQPLGEGMVNFEAYFEQIKHMGISGPISLHLEYEVTEDPAAAPAERHRKTLAAMQRDVQTLQSMLETAGLY